MQHQHRHLPIAVLDSSLQFPEVDQATSEGLLAIGGDLSVSRLLLAYRKGIFPWFNDDALILWWAPDPRMVLFPEKIKISKSMRKVFAEDRFRLTKNQCFDRVLDHCASVERKGQDGTWITAKMKQAYLELHRKGYAQSYEVWEGDFLAGGLYGVDLGHVFCGESMFSIRPNASKYAFIQLAKKLRQQGYGLIDCQVPTDHLRSLGAEAVPREKFMAFLEARG